MSHLEESCTAVESERSAMSPRSEWVRRTAVVCALAIPAAVQIVGGFGDVGQLEEWGFFGLFDSTGPLYWLGTDSAINSQAMRPLTVFPNGVAWSISSNSFHGYHLLQGLALSLRAISMYLLICQLKWRRSSAIAAALFFALFPAWTGLFVFRTVHFHFASASITLAGWLLLRAQDRVRKSEIAAMIVLAAAGVMFYEGYYSAVVIMPALLLIRGIGRRRMIELTCLWFIGPVVNGLRIVWILRYGPTQYQGEIVSADRRSGAEIVDLFGRVWWGVARSIVDPPLGWRISWLCLVAIAVTATALWSAAAGSLREPRPPAVRQFVIATLGFAFAPIAALVYWGNATHLSDPLRIFSMAAFPVAVGAAALLQLAKSIKVEVVTCVGLCVVSLLSSVSQRHEVHLVSEFQSRFLGEVVRLASDAGLPSNYVVYDPERRIGGVYTLLDPYPAIALRYLLDDQSVRMAVCHMTPDAARALPDSERCHLDDRGVTLDDGLRSSSDASLVMHLQGSLLLPVSVPPGQPVAIPERPSDALDCVSADGCEPIPIVDGGFADD